MSKDMRPAPNWNPRRYTQTLPSHGHQVRDAYCSPSCGFHCAHAAFEQATREAAELAARMGPGWEPRVWENWGWNYQVSKGRAEIHVRREGSGWAGGWIIVGYTGWIQCHPQFISAVHADPASAFKEAVAIGEAKIAELIAAVAEGDA